MIPPTMVICPWGCGGDQRIPLLHFLAHLILVHRCTKEEIAEVLREVA